MVTKTPTEILNAYLKLDDKNKGVFLHMLSMHMLINLPDGEWMMVTKKEFAEIQRRADLFTAIKNNLEGYQ